ncbi:MAG TPA: sigma-70 family RNA polymerase sigma factor [Cytophagaceae bacterium]
MKDALSIPLDLNAQRNEAIKNAFQKDKKRLFQFIRKRVPQPSDAEDILQDVFYQFSESFNVMQPIEQVSAWLFRVARNKIIDRYRKHKPELLEDQKIKSDDSDEYLPAGIAELLFDPKDTPEEMYMGKVIRATLAEALEELPEEQSSVFVLHELEGKSFKEIAEMTGEPVNTLISRKRYAVLYLREKLKDLYREMSSH